MGVPSKCSLFDSQMLQKKAEEAKRLRSKLQQTVLQNQNEAHQRFLRLLSRIVQLNKQIEC